jgi:DNA-binding PucR family transcriptional regulator
MSESVSRLRPDAVSSLLLQLRDVTSADPAAAELARMLVAPLAREDAQRGNNLVATLRAYYTCAARVDRTASALFLHRNSVRYRLDRIRTLLGLDIDEPPVIAALTVALACHEIAAEGRAHAG